MSFSAWLLDAPAWAILLVGLAALIIGLLVIIYKQLRASTTKDEIENLKIQIENESKNRVIAINGVVKRISRFEVPEIEQPKLPDLAFTVDFDPDKHFKEEDVPSRVSGVEMAKKRYFWMYVTNTSGSDIKNVGIQLDKIEERPNRASDHILHPHNCRANLCFERDNAQVMQFSFEQTEKVSLISRTQDIAGSAPICIIATSESFNNRERVDHLYLKITGEGIKPIPFILSAWVENNHLRMAWVQTPSMTS